MPPTKVAIVFDLDDTLWDTNLTLAQAHRKFLAWCADGAPGTAVSDDAAFRAAVAKMAVDWQDPHKLMELMRTVMARGGALASNYTLVRKTALMEFMQAAAPSETPERLQLFADTLFDYWYKWRNTPVFFDGAIAALEVLAKHPSVLHLGTLTDGNAQPKLIPGLQDKFAFSLRGQDIGALKPSPKVFDALKASVADPSAKLVYVGDDWGKDVLGSQAAGCQPVWINNSHLRGREAGFLIHRTPGPEGGVVPSDVVVVESVAQLAAEFDDILARL